MYLIMFRSKVSRLKIRHSYQNISIKTAAKAATSPVAPNNDPVGQALNRRVEIQVK